MTRRPWTAQDQIAAEVAAACGVSYAEIGRTLGRASSLVAKKLDPNAAEKARESGRRWYKRWYEANADKACARARSWREANADKHRANCRRWHEANTEKERESRRRYYEVNAEKIRDQWLLYREANPDKCHENCRRWREANSDRVREYSHLYRQVNRDKIRERRRLYCKANADNCRKTARRYYEVNAEKIRDRARRYSKANRDIRCETQRRRSARKRAARKQALMPVTPPQIELRRDLWRHRCAFCGVNAQHPRNAGHRRLTEEHVLALSNNGLDEADNIMPACNSCNCSKSNASIEEWYRRQPFFTEARWRKICRYCPGAVVGQLPLAFSPPDAEPA